MKLTEFIVEQSNLFRYCYFFITSVLYLFIFIVYMYILEAKLVPCVLRTPYIYREICLASDRTPRCIPSLEFKFGSSPNPITLNSCIFVHFQTPFLSQSILRQDKR